MSGVTLLTIRGTDYILKAPTRIQKYLAQIEYERALHDLDFEAHLTKESALASLITLGVVPKDIDQKLEKLDKDVDKLKHTLFLHNVDPQKCRSIRDALKATRVMHARLYVSRHYLDHLTLEGYAETVRIYMLFSFCLQTRSGGSVNDPEIIEAAVLRFGSHRITNEQLREVARTEPWRSTWNAYGKSVFGNEHTDEQRVLVLFSQMYDSIYKSTEVPDDFIIHDDDMLDGWMIEQKKERDREAKTNKTKNKGKGGPNYDADEIYLFKQPNDKRTHQEFVQDTDGLNSFEAKMIKSQRNSALKAKGVLKESELPDIQRGIQIQAQQQMAEKFRK